MNANDIAPLRETITQSQWSDLCDGLSQNARSRLANWIAHGVITATKTPDGIVITRSDWDKKGKCLVLSDKNDAWIPKTELTRT